MNASAAARVARAAEGLPRRRFTVAEVEAMVAAGVMEEDERVELIGGELVPMSPKGNQHEVVKIALDDRWVRARPDDCRISPETTFRLSEDTYLEPDFVIYLPRDRPEEPQRRERPARRRNRRFLAHATTGRKAALYARFGVRELWSSNGSADRARLAIPPRRAYRFTRISARSDRFSPRFAPEAFALRLDELELLE